MSKSWKLCTLSHNLEGVIYFHKILLINMVSGLLTVFKILKKIYQVCMLITAVAVYIFVIILDLINSDIRLKTVFNAPLIHIVKRGLEI